MNFSLPVPSGNPAVALAGVSWGPPGRPDIIRDVSLTVACGEVLAICGPNGAGKSSVLRLIYRQYRARSGQVRLAGRDIAAMPSRDLARAVAVVLQEHVADPGLTVRQVVDLGRLPHRAGFFATGGSAPVDRAIAVMDLGAIADRRCDTLSGGERQRAMVARALAQEPQVLVLDEPTNHLDIRHQIDLLALLRGLGLTVIVTLHDLAQAAEHADRVAVLHEGRLIACGPPATALSADTLTTAFRVRARGALQSAFQI